ncbi:MAG TPA: DUF4336 domain-containing protein [Myxococcales bacterium LLY-WYZ-16_1]|nr:DUF4336 domain-containing protein [Myxococcales bacterium LLY-WYZ-16_1]
MTNFMEAATAPLSSSSEPKLKDFAPGVWLVHRPVKLAPGLRFPCTMTVLRTEDRRLLIHSPFRIGPSTASSLEKLGEVRFVVAPNLFHHLFLPSAAEAFPQAAVFGPSGLAKKRPEISRLQAFEDGLPSDWPPEIEVHSIDGAPRVRERVLLHRPSRTLVVTDLLFNIENAKGFAIRSILWAAGTLEGLAKSRITRMLTQNRDAFDRSVDGILQLDFDRLIMAHGSPIPTGAKARVRQTLLADR